MLLPHSGAMGPLSPLGPYKGLYQGYLRDESRACGDIRVHVSKVVHIYICIYGESGFRMKEIVHVLGSPK